MRVSSVLLAVSVAALLVIHGSASPCGRDNSNSEEYVAASKTTKSTEAESSATDQSSEQIKANSGTGEYSETSAQSSTKTAAASEDSSSESYVYYKKGAAPCDDSLPARKSGECDEVYYKRIFPVNECDQASVKAFYAKVFKQYKGECETNYVKRIDIILTIYKSLDCRTNVKHIQYLEKYYTIKYAKKSGESDEEYLKRTITKTTETEEVYTNKITILKKYITTVDWTKVTVVYTSTTGYTLEKSTSASTEKSVKSCGSTKTLTEEEVKKTYARKDKECDQTYFERIVKKSSTSVTTEEYIQTITLIRKSFPSLDLWYNKKYIPLVTEYYVAIYTKKTSESEEIYYKRIVTKETYETEEQCAKRVEVVRELCPNLSLWSEERFYETYTKKIYSVVCKRSEGEEETTYFQRIVAKSEKETDTVYVGRITLIQKTFPSISVWYSEKTFTIVQRFYKLKYTKKSGECDSDYIKRLFVKESCDTSDEIYVQRIHLIHKVTVTSSVWYNEKYYEEITKIYYSVYYKKGDKEACVAWLTRVITQLPGECEENSIKRIKLINKTQSGCGCWTADNFSKLECSKTFSKEYLVVVKRTFIVKKSSKSTSGKSAGCQDNTVTIVKRGNKG